MRPEVASITQKQINANSWTVTNKTDHKDEICKGKEVSRDVVHRTVTSGALKVFTQPMFCRSPVSGPSRRWTLWHGIGITGGHLQNAHAIWLFIADQGRIISLLALTRFPFLFHVHHVQWNGKFEQVGKDKKNANHVPNLHGVHVRNTDVGPNLLGDQCEQCRDRQRGARWVDGGGDPEGGERGQHDDERRYESLDQVVARDAFEHYFTVEAGEDTWKKK